MTRAEQLARMEKRSQEKLDLEKRRLARVHAAQRDAARKVRDARRQRWGAILDQIGILDHDDVHVRAILTVAYRLWREGRVSAAASEVDAEVEQFIADHVTLVLVDDAGGAAGGGCRKNPGYTSEFVCDKALGARGIGTDGHVSI